MAASTRSYVFPCLCMHPHTDKHMYADNMCERTRAHGASHRSATDEQAGRGQRRGSGQRARPKCRLPPARPGWRVARSVRPLLPVAGAGRVRLCHRAQPRAAMLSRAADPNGQAAPARPSGDPRRRWIPTLRCGDPSPHSDRHQTPNAPRPGARRRRQMPRRAIGHHVRPSDPKPGAPPHARQRACGRGWIPALGAGSTVAHPPRRDPG